MASRGKGARNKGAQYERDIAKRLSELTGLKFKRGLGQARGAVEEGADVQGALEDLVHFELKRHKKSPLKPAMEQAIRDRQGDAIPIVIAKDDYKPDLVVMHLDHWEDMFKAWLIYNEIIADDAEDL